MVRAMSNTTARRQRPTAAQDRLTAVENGGGAAPLTPAERFRQVTERVLSTTPAQLNLLERKWLSRRIRPALQRNA